MYVQAGGYAVFELYASIKLDWLFFLIDVFISLGKDDFLEWMLSRNV